MYPAASVSGLYFGPFRVALLRCKGHRQDQVESYAVREEMAVTEVERWLGPVSGYGPARK